MGIEDLEGLSKPYEGFEQTTDELSLNEKAYLQEIQFSNEEWPELNDTQKFYNLDLIDARMDELGIDPSRRDAIACELYSSSVADAYSDYQADSSWAKQPFEQVEAPQDHIQIEQISDVLADCEELKYENWEGLELCEKEALLNSLEDRIAEIEHRPSCPISLVPLEGNTWGGYNPSTKSITINSNYAELSDYGTYREIIDTLVHEGRHAYQDYNVNVCETHPRHSEVASWAETMEGGKWGYWGDCSTILGQRLYDQQSIEIDARNFAADVLEQMDLKA